MAEQGFKSRYFVCYLCCELFSLKTILVDHLVQHLKQDRYCFNCEIGVKCNQHDDDDHHQQQKNGSRATAVNGNDHSNAKHRKYDDHQTEINSEQLKEAIHWANYMVGRQRGPRMKLTGCPVCEINTVYAELRETRKEEKVESLTKLRDELRVRLFERMTKLQQTFSKQLISPQSIINQKELFHIFSHVYYSPFRCNLCELDNYSCAINSDKIVQHIKLHHWITENSAEHVKLLHFPALIDFVNHFASIYHQSWSLSAIATLSNGHLPLQSSCISSSQQVSNIMERALQSVRGITPLDSNSLEPPFKPDGQHNGDRTSNGFGRTFSSSSEDLQPPQLGPPRQSTINELFGQSGDESDDSACMSTSLDCFLKFQDRAHFDAMLSRKSYSIPEEWYKCKGLVQEIQLKDMGLGESTVMLPEEADSAKSIPDKILAIQQPPSTFAAATSLALGKARKSSSHTDRGQMNVHHHPPLSSQLKISTDNEKSFDNLMSDQEALELRAKINANKCPDEVFVKNKHYYCPLCMRLFDNLHHLNYCLRNDLGYFPLHCSTCNQSTMGLDSMRLHYHDEHPNQVKAVYTEHHDKLIENWLSFFIAKQRTSVLHTNHLFKTLDFNCSSCLMTAKLDQVQPLAMTKVTKSYFDVEHIFDHLRYYPYQCVLCDPDQHRAYSSPGKNARQHMKSNHNKTLNSKETAKYLQLKYQIVSLERCVKQTIDNVYALMSEEQRKSSNYDDDLYEMLRTSWTLNESNGKQRIGLPLTCPLSESLTALVSASSFSCIPTVNVTTPTPIAAIANFSAEPFSKIDEEKEKESTMAVMLPLQPKTSSTGMTNGVDVKKSEKRLVVKRSALDSIRETHSADKLEHFSSIGLGKQNNSNLPKIAVQTRTIDANQQPVLANCFFCAKCLPSTQSLLIHLTSSHLEYFPVICDHCDRRFACERQLKLHGKLHPNENQFSFHLQSNFINDRWLDRFISNSIDRSKVDFRMVFHCMVCSELATANQRTQYHEWCFTTKPADEDSELGVYENACEFYYCAPHKWQVMSHVYAHLCYTPYRCRLCYEQNQDTCFELLDNRCVEHLRLHTNEHICSGNVRQFVERLPIEFIDEILTAKELFDLDFIKSKPCGKCPPPTPTQTPTKPKKLFNL